VSRRPTKSWPGSRQCLLAIGSDGYHPDAEEHAIQRARKEHNSACSALRISFWISFLCILLSTHLAVHACVVGRSARQRNYVPLLLHLATRGHVGAHAPAQLRRHQCVPLSPASKQTNNSKKIGQSVGRAEIWSVKSSNDQMKLCAFFVQRQYVCTDGGRAVGATVFANLHVFAKPSSPK
jgi:hypothetical protein